MAVACGAYFEEQVIRPWLGYADVMDLIWCIVLEYLSVLMHIQEGMAFDRSVLNATAIRMQMNDSDEPSSSEPLASEEGWLVSWCMRIVSWAMVDGS